MSKFLTCFKLATAVGSHHNHPYVSTCGTDENYLNKACAALKITQNQLISLRLLISKILISDQYVLSVV